MSADKTKPETPEKPKKGKGMLLAVSGGVVLLAAGGGGMLALVQAGLIGGGHAQEEEKDFPKLIRKGDEDPYAPVQKEAESQPLVHGEGGSKYRTIYYDFEGGFTSNLKDSDALVQVSLAASTRRDGRMLMWLKEHELAVRSAILVTLADTPEMDVTSPAGKQRLERRLTAAINKVLQDKEGFGGIDAIHFQSFIVQ